MSTAWSVIANGQPLTEKQIKGIPSTHQLLAIDGGANQPIFKQRSPNVVLGDFDSIAEKQYQEYKQQPDIEVVDASNQNKTDLEKALDYLVSQEATDVYLYSATGERMDHTFFLVSVLNRYAPYFKRLIAQSSTESIECLKNTSIKINGQIGDTVSLMGAPEYTAKSQGLLYPLNEQPMSYWQNNSISNALSENTATIDISGAALIIYQDTNELLICP